MEHKETLSKENPKLTLNLNKDEPYLKITKVDFPDFDGNDKNLPHEISGLSLKYKKYNSHTNSPLENFVFLPQGVNIDANQRGTSTKLNKILNESDEFEYSKIELLYENTGDKNFSMDVYYETKNLEVSLKNPWLAFKPHLEEPDNSKILFSAPFGTGKTTFLKEFFDLNTTEYEVFHLYPVNYSISHNEDIFQYIKCELLFQLLGKDIAFDKENFSHELTLPSYAKEHLHDMLLPFLRLIPKIGQDIHSIANDLIKVAKDYIDSHKESQIDDKEEAKNFIKEYYEKEGSVYEDNFYTQLIRQLIEQLKTNGKKSVLIIDDTDRMDPEHIFRILNVFAAHFDTPEYRPPSGFPNKFGFDKIIIVCDYSNLRKIFSHRYGPDTDFSGYIDKFFSKSKFVFNNKAAIAAIIKEIGSKYDEDPIKIIILQMILIDLIETESLSLREILKIGKFDLSILFGKGLSREFRELQSSCIIHIHLLCQLTDIETIIKKLAQHKDKLNNKHSTNAFFLTEYHYSATACLIPLVLTEHDFSETEQYTYQHENKKLSFNIKRKLSARSEDYYVENLTVNNELNNNYKFTQKDFYELLIKVAEKYKELEAKLNG